MKNLEKRETSRFLRFFIPVTHNKVRWVDVAALHLSSFTRVTFSFFQALVLLFTATYFIILLLSASVQYL